jgi:hypothetical protein
MRAADDADFTDWEIPAADDADSTDWKYGPQMTPIPPIGDTGPQDDACGLFEITSSSGICRFLKPVHLRNFRLV